MPELLVINTDGNLCLCPPSKITTSYDRTLALSAKAQTGYGDQASIGYGTGDSRQVYADGVRGPLWYAAALAGAPGHYAGFSVFTTRRLCYSRGGLLYQAGTANPVPTIIGGVSKGNTTKTWSRLYDQEGQYPTANLNLDKFRNRADFVNAVAPIYTAGISWTENVGGDPVLFEVQDPFAELIIQCRFPDVDKTLVSLGYTWGVRMTWQAGSLLHPPGYALVYYQPYFVQWHKILNATPFPDVNDLNGLQLDYDSSTATPDASGRNLGDTPANWAGSSVTLTVSV